MDRLSFTPWLAACLCTSDVVASTQELLVATNSDPVKCALAADAEAPASSPHEDAAEGKRQSATHVAKTAAPAEPPAAAAAASALSPVAPPTAEQGPHAAAELPRQEALFRAMGVDFPHKGGPPGHGVVPGMMLDDYVTKFPLLFEGLRRMEADEGWTFKRRQDGVDIFTRHLTDKPVTCFKGRTIMPLKGKPLRSVLEAIMRTQERPLWDSMCMLGQVLECQPPFYQINYLQIASPFLPIIANRDLTVIGRMSLDPDGAVVLAFHSIALPGRPEEKGFVRCNFLEGGFVVRPVPGKDEVSILYAGCVDPMGWLPGWVKDFVAWEQALTLAKFVVWFAGQQ